MSATGKPGPRYVIRAPQGEELICPSLADLVALYRQGFLADDDLVRSEHARRFVRAGDLPALHGARERRREPGRMLVLLLVVAVLVLGLVLALRGLAPRGGAAAAQGTAAGPRAGEARSGEARR